MTERYDSDGNRTAPAHEQESALHAAQAANRDLPQLSHVASCTVCGIMANWRKYELAYEGEPIGGTVLPFHENMYEPQRSDCAEKVARKLTSREEEK